MVSSKTCSRGAGGAGGGGGAAAGGDVRSRHRAVLSAGPCVGGGLGGALAGVGAAEGRVSSSAGALVPLVSADMSRLDSTCPPSSPLCLVVLAL